MVAVWAAVLIQLPVQDEFEGLVWTAAQHSQLVARVSAHHRGLTITVCRTISTLHWLVAKGRREQAVLDGAHK